VALICRGVSGCEKGLVARKCVVASIPPAVKNKALPTVTVGQLYTNHADQLHLKLLAGAGGLQRRIVEGAVNRPGLALTGFYKSFAFNRVQVIGSGETKYLKSLPDGEGRKRLQELFKHRIPCVIFARNINPPAVVLEVAEEENIAVFKSPLTTMRLINTTTICLELDFAPTASEHGSMVDILGIGVMVRGASGIGKSECVLSLVERRFARWRDASLLGPPPTCRAFTWRSGGSALLTSRVFMASAVSASKSGSTWW
jgi:hypothetical protein